MPNDRIKILSLHINIVRCIPRINQQKEDLIKVANEYGEYYLLQDYLREDGLTDVSIIKSTNGSLEFYIENNGRVWLVKSGEINLTNSTSKSIKK